MATWRDVTDESVEVEAGLVKAYFPAGIDAAFLTVEEARAWVDALRKAADEAELMAS